MDIKLIEVKEDILADNEKLAEEIRERLRDRKTLLVNLMSSPGAGKTSLLLRTAEGLKGGLRLGVIEADIASQVDAEKMAASGVPAIQLRTGGLCHLDAAMVEQGIQAIDDGGFDLLVIENVGNLVCPAEFDTGAHRNVMILSVPEGDDKPLKYPLMFSLWMSCCEQDRLPAPVRLRSGGPATAGPGLEPLHEDSGGFLPDRGRSGGMDRLVEERSGRYPKLKRP
jgi:hydrogenase nickel incorporation protein HypB